MENLSLRVSGHVNSMNRTFIVEDYAEDEFGPWAKDEVTGEQGYDDDERSCFWTWDDTWVCLASQTIQGPPGEKKRRKKKRKRQRTILKGLEEHSVEMNRYKIPNGGQKRSLLGGPKERQARKACQKAMKVYRRVVGKDFLPNRSRGKDQTGKRQRRTNLDSQPHKHPIKKDVARPGNQTIGLPVFGRFLDSRCWVVLHKDLYCMGGGNPIESCQPSNACCSGLWLHTVDRIRAAIERFKRHAWYCGITMQFCRCDKSLMFANSETETCKESCIIHFPTIQG